MEDTSQQTAFEGKPEWEFNPGSSSDEYRIVATGRAKPYRKKSKSHRNQASSQTTRRNQAHQTESEQTNHHNSAQQATTEEVHEDNLGRVSDYWKNAGGALFGGSLFFILAGALMLGFTYYPTPYLLYGIFALSLLYGVTRLALSYYLYKDAKTIRYHSRERANKPWTPVGYGWQPKAFYWGVFTFFMPPGMEYGPAAIYFYRRHAKTGVP